MLTSYSSALCLVIKYGEDQSQQVFKQNDVTWSSEGTWFPLQAAAVEEPHERSSEKTAFLLYLKKTTAVADWHSFRLAQFVIQWAASVYEAMLK